VRNTSLNRARPGVAGRLAGLALAAGLAVAGIAAASPAAADQHGPNPTAAGLERNGPYQVDQYSATNVRGFANGTIYAPRSSTERFGVVSITPGFVSAWAQMAWMGPRLASHGFIVIGVNTNSAFDGPTQRAEQQWAALQNVLADSRVSSRLDRGRLAVAGWSMGGGGTLENARAHPELRAAIPMAPWNLLNKNWSTTRVPTLIMAADGDIVAPNPEHSTPFYNTLASSEKALAIVNGDDHFLPTHETRTQSRMYISWLKRFVDDDTRYTQFLCPGPSVGTILSELDVYRSTCPM
jgi:dienelactone hydrolase